MRATKRNKMTDLFIIPPHQLFPSLAVPKHPPSPRAALRAVTSLTPVSHRQEEEAPHVTAEQRYIHTGTVSASFINTPLSL